MDQGLNKPRGVSFNGTYGRWTLLLRVHSLFAFWVIPFALCWSVLALATLIAVPFVSVFFLPVALFIVGLAAMTIAGQYRLTVEGTDAILFVGVGNFGYTRRFDWSKVHSVAVRRVRRLRRPRAIALEADQPIYFGAFLTQRQRVYAASVLSVLAGA